MTVLCIVFAGTEAQDKSVQAGALKKSDSNRFYVRYDFKLVEWTQWDSYLRQANKKRSLPSQVSRPTAHARGVRQTCHPLNSPESISC